MIKRLLERFFMLESSRNKIRMLRKLLLFASLPKWGEMGVFIGRKRPRVVRICAECAYIRNIRTVCAYAHDLGAFLAHSLLPKAFTRL